MPDVLEMNADLVRAAAMERALHERAAGHFAAHAPVRTGGTPALDDGHFFAMHGMPPDRRIDGPARCGGCARDEGQVNFHDFAARELPHECAMGDIVFRRDEATAGVLVQPMNDAGAHLAADTG